MNSFFLIREETFSLRHAFHLRWCITLEQSIKSRAPGPVREALSAEIMLPGRQKNVTLDVSDTAACSFLSFVVYV
ncbi:hypothetical protein ARC310_20875 [Pantoea ananatis]|nr:hypothetical protein ARC310_20875 [Pantoea ananatis]PZD69747.1 hypothetical protein ARC311_02015 [Pantoea ananatis]